MNDELDSFSFSPLAPGRLDETLAACGKSISRRGAKRLLSEHRVVVNGKTTAVASRFTSPGDRVSVIGNLPQLALVLNSNDFIVIDKPAGMASQPAVEQSIPSSAEILSSRLRRSGEPGEIFVVHRLDLNTSGVLLFAKTSRSARTASDAFARGAVKKKYLALLQGAVKEQRTVDTPIGRVDGETFGVTDDGKNALTIIRPLLVEGDVTLAEVEIRTGRTHQIRVHLSSIGHPVIGDRKYNGGQAPRHLSSRPMLHARLLEVAGLTLVAALPPDFLSFAHREGLGALVAFLQREEPAATTERI